MIRNYLRLTIRTIARQPGYSFINVAGLATGMAAFILITMFIQHEMSFDRHIPNNQNIYRVDLNAVIAEQAVNTANSPSVMAGAFLDAFPEVVAASRFDAFAEDQLVMVGDRAYYEPDFFLADSSAFDLLGITLLEGDATNALNRPGTLVLSKTLAQTYFGEGLAVGKTVRWDNRTDFEVTGVMEEWPETSHFRPDILASFLNRGDWDSPIWLNNSIVTYIELSDGADPGVLEAKFPVFQESTLGPQIEQFMGQSLAAARSGGLRYDWKLQRISDAYLHSDAEDQLGASGDIRYLYILGLIAVFVLLIACVNFVNLSTARASGRAREVGVRKVMGSDRGQLIRQFLGESTAVSVIAMLIAFAIVLAALPYFQTLAGAPLSMAPWLIGVMVLTAIATGLVAGLYPAFVLSSFRPVVVLKGSFSRSKQGTALRSGLVVFQFAITVALLVGTSVVYKQLNFIQNQELGFDQQQLVVVPIETDQGAANFGTLRDGLMSYASIVNVGAGGALPGPQRIHNNVGFRPEGGREDQVFLAGLAEVSDDYVETLGMNMAAGRDFDPAFPSDSSAVVINEAMAAQLGWTVSEAVGKGLTRLDLDQNRESTIIGVVADAHYTSLHTQILPLVFGHRPVDMFYAAVRVRPENMPETLAVIEAQWSQFEPGYPFRYFFLDEDYARFYEREQRLGSLYGYFTILALLIACLGLFGLASFVTTQRTREIGVRKAMGATAGSIVVLLSKEFTRLVLVACAVAFPIAWFAMSRWLEDFAFATEIGLGVFLWSGIAALAVAWLTVGYQSIRAALSNPVTSLRYE